MYVQLYYLLSSKSHGSRSLESLELLCFVNFYDVPQHLSQFLTDSSWISHF